MPALSEVVSALEAIAPLRLAGDWDNVGLLVEGTRPVRRVALAIDLTEPVLAEVLAHDVDLVVAYHPPIFGGLKRLTTSSPTGRKVLAAVREGISIYSPHTALDAAAGGMNDWLVDGLDPQAERRPIEPDTLDPGVGAGRTATLAPLSLPDAIARLKEHLGLDHVRVATPDDGLMIRTLAVCPGAGGSVFGHVRRADLFVTGELRHHDVLARVADGSAVILTDHTHTERGYLPVLARRLRQAVDVEVHVSSVDDDPLRVV